MPFFYPNSSCIWQAEQMRADLANSEVHLFQSTLVPDTSTTLAQLQAEEADYDGYAPITVAAWLGAIMSAAGGASIQAPTVQFEYVDGVNHTGNIIGGFWLETAAGVLVAIGTFDTPIPMQMNDQGIPLDVLLRFPTGL